MTPSGDTRAYNRTHVRNALVLMPHVRAVLTAEEQTEIGEAESCRT